MNGLPKKKASPVPNSIRAMPMATSLTRGNLQRNPCSKPNSPPASPATATPAQGEFVRTAVA